MSAATIPLLALGAVSVMTFGCAHPNVRVSHLDASSAALCIGNVYDEKGGRIDRIAADSRQVCQALRTRGVATRVIDDRGEGDSIPTWTALAPAWSSAISPLEPRILFYEGHAEFPRCANAGAKGSGMCILSSSALAWTDWHALPELVTEAAVPGVPNVLILNGCNSGFADVHGVRAPFSLLGSGYGEVPVDKNGFADVLAAVIATGDHDVNCDGVLSDRELQLAVNRKLKAEQSSETANAIAVVRRQADAEVPVVRVGTPSARCASRTSLSALLHDQRAASLPCSLRLLLEQQEEMLRGVRRHLVESPLRYLWVEDNRRCEDGAAVDHDGLVELLTSRADVLGIVVVRVPETEPAFSEYLGEIARFATFTRMHRLRMTNRVLTLESLTDGEQLAAIAGEYGRCAGSHAAEQGPPARAIARRVLACVPRRVQLTGSSMGLEDLGCQDDPPALADNAISGQCSSPGGAESCITIKVDGRFPTSSVRLTRVDDLLDQGAAGRALVLEPLEPVPCFSGVGQCFAVGDSSPTHRSPQDWLLIEDELSGLVAKAKAEEASCRK